MDEGYLFLSYARVDAQLVKLASTLLAERGWKTWVDRTDIPSASDWMSAIRAGIEQADGFVFVMTPHSIASRMCRVELSIATELGKRLLPLMPIDAATWAAETAKINADPKLAPAAEVPAELAKLDYVDLADFVDKPDPFAALMDELVKTASRDLEWLRRHTSLQRDVRRWVDTRYAPSVLLREPLLTEAESMLTVADKDPALTALQREFVTKSRIELARELEREAAQLAARILDLPPERLHLGLMLALEGRERYLATPRLEGALRTLFARWPQRYLVPHVAPVYSIAFSRDGALFATAAVDGVRVIETATGRLLRNWRGPMPVTCVEFLADGNTLAVGWGDGRVQIAQLDADDAMEFHIGKDPIIGLVPSPDGAHLAAYGGVSLAVIDLRGNAHARGRAQPAAVLRARWHSSDQLVATCDDGAVRTFRLADGDMKAFALPENPVHDLAIGAGAAHEIFAAGKFDGLAVLDADTRELLEHLPFAGGSVLGLAASDGGERLVMQNMFGRVFVVDTATRKVVFERNILHSLAATLALGPRGTLIGAGSRNGMASVLTVDARVEQILAGHDGRVTAMTFDSAGRRALTAGEDGTVRLWDVASVPGRTTISVNIPVQAALSRDGARILTASRDGAARLFDRGTGTKLIEVPGEADTLHSAEFATDDTEILLTYNDGRLVFIDPVTGKQLRASHGAPPQKSDSASQAVGDVQLVREDGEGPPRYALVVRGESLGALRAPTLMARAILSPDGVYAFGAAIDAQAVYVFDSRRNELIATLPLEHNANDVHVSADGRWLLATWLDRVTAIEFPPVVELVARVRAQLSRGLRDAERREFGIDVTAPATAS
jgi:WD40 repeat protein